MSDEKLTGTEVVRVIAEVQAKFSSAMLPIPTGFQFSPEDFYDLVTASDKFSRTRHLIQFRHRCGVGVRLYDFDITPSDDLKRGEYRLEFR